MWKTTMSMLGACALLAACGPGQEAAAPPAEPGYQKVLQQQLLDAKPGDVIEIPAGRHALDRSLSLRVDGVTIRGRSEEHTSELQSLMRTSYAVFCLQKKNTHTTQSIQN